MSFERKKIVKTSEHFSLLELQSLPLIEIKDSVLRKEILLDWKKNLMQSSNIEDFLLSFKILTENLETSFFYFRLFTAICQELEPRVLTKHCESNEYIKLTVKNLKNYLISKKSQKFRFLETHSKEITSRLKFLEVLNKNSLCEISKSEEKLVKIVFCLYPDQVLCEFFNKSYFDGLSFGSLCNNYFFSLKKLTDSQLLAEGSVNFYFFQFFLKLFIKGNEDFSVKVKNGSISWVIDGDIKGFDELILIFFNSEGLIMKESLKVLLVLLTTFSTSLEKNYHEVCLGLFNKIRIRFDDQSSQHVERLVKILQFYMKDILDTDKVDVELLYQGKKHTGGIFKRVRVSKIFTILEKYFKVEDKSLLFSIGSQKYGPQDQFEFIDLNENDLIIVYDSKEFFKTSCNQFLELFECFSDTFRRVVPTKGKISYKLFESFIIHKIPESSLSLITNHFIDVKEIEKKNEYDQFLVNVQILKSSVTQKNCMIMFESSQKHKDYLHYLIRYLDKQEYAIKLIDYIAKFCKYSIEYSENHSLLLQLFYKLILMSYRNIIFIYDKAIINSFRVCESPLLDIFECNDLVRINQDFVFEYFEPICESFSVPFVDSTLSVYLLKTIVNIIKNSQSIILFTERFLQMLQSDFISNNYSASFYVVFKLFKSIHKNSIETAKKIIQISFNHLETFDIKDHQYENPNLFIMLNLLNDYFDMINPPQSLQNFIDSLVFSTDSTPICKSRDSRFLGFELSSKLLKSHPAAFNWFGPKLLKMIRCQHWRKLSEGSWNISLNLSPSFDSFKGLKNPACICYSNSLIQHLFHIKSFRASVLSLELKDDFNCLSALQSVFLKLENCKSSSVSGKNLIRAFHGSDNFYEQMDADEFLLRLFEKCLNIGTASNFEEVLNEHFLGSQLNEYCSLDCPHSLKKEQNFWTLGLNVFKGAKNSLRASLDHFIKGEVLEGQNSILCEKCKKRVKFVIKPSLVKLPRYLIFSLKRFEYQVQLGTRTKLHDKFSIPDEINMKEYANQEVWTEAPEDFLYRIKGVTIHVGIAQSGHYYSIVNTADENWHKFNDTRVRQVTKEEMIQLSTGELVGDDFQPSAYLILYEKVQKNEFKYNRLAKEPKAGSQINLELVKQGQMAGIKDFVFSEDFFLFMRTIASDQKYHLAYVEFFFNCVLRSSVNFKYFMKFYQKLEEITETSEILYILSILTSRDGALEFLVKSPHKSYIKLLLLLIKKLTPSIDKKLVKGWILKLLSVIRLYFNALIHCPDSVIHLIVILTEVLEDNDQKFFISNFFLKILMNEEFDHTAFFGEKSDLVWKIDWKSIIKPKFEFEFGYSQLYKYIQKHLDLLTKKQASELTSLDILWHCVKINYSKSEKISYNKMIASLLSIDTKKSLFFLEYLIKKYSDSLETYILKNIHLFLKYHSQKLLFFVNIIEQYLDVMVRLKVEEISVWYKYFIKLFYNLKFDDVRGYLTDSTVEVIHQVKKILDVHVDLQKYSGIYENFISGYDQFVFDSDDELDPASLHEENYVFFTESKKHKPSLMKIVKNFENEVICLSINENHEILVDSSEFEKIRLT